MKKIYIYPGTFCPPHYGHAELAKEAAKMFGKITVVCSANPLKGDRPVFSPKDCVEMWKTYKPGRNIKVTTIDEFLKKRGKKDALVMIRGIRNDDDIVYENDILRYNRDNYGITHYHYIIANPRFRDMSSTAIWEAARAGNDKELKSLVTKKVAEKVAEYIKKNK
ncbi:MAG: adenylyltransferase/cytidyltransferase family protein [Candidatus Pacebacteria bacterium]|jgi:pantetheine-phosphate adenylyltransferase|nr:adenylyltransferase/cytidyltransferase family protein [Candidatus Paceibacterota bacterium]